MGITESEIVIYSSENMPEDDLSKSGGAINSGIRIVFEDIQSNSIISAFSDDNSDSGILTVTGRNINGILRTEQIPLSGITTVSGVQIFERILSSQIDTIAVGNITISGETEIAKIYPTESGFRRIFYNAMANPSGGSDKTLYEKAFIKNNNASLPLQNATAQEVTTGLYTTITFGLEKSLNYNESVRNRLNAPTGTTVYGSGASGIAGSSLTSLDAQGLWLKMELPAGSNDINSFYKIKIEGITF